MRIALCGYLGKMGSAAYEVLKEEYDVIGIDVEEDLAEIIREVDLVVDFTNKESAKQHIKLCLEYQKNFICGTTGFTADELAKIKSSCNRKRIKGIICYNFATPIHFMLQHMEEWKKYYPNIEYLDIHHVTKKDKKSGTLHLFLMKNDQIQVRSLQTKKNTITYLIKMKSKYDKLIITYQVNDRKAFALGLLQVIKSKSEEGIMNLLC